MNSRPLLIAGVILVGAAIATAVWVALSWQKRSPRRPRTQGGSIAQIRTDVVRMTSRLVDDRTNVDLARRLEQAGSQLRTGEWIIGVLALSLLSGAIGFAVGNSIGAVMLVLVVPAIAVTLLNRNISRRQEAFGDQLPELLQNLSSALRSGQSLPQAVASIAAELEAPAGDELRRVVVENRIGRDLVTSFQDLAHRMGSTDFDWVVRAIEINQRSGGDLSTILRRLDATIRARNHVAGAVRSLSAEGRISGVVLTVLPIAMLITLQFLNPNYLEPLFQTNLGRLMLLIGGTQLFIGSIWLSRLARFKF